MKDLFTLAILIVVVVIPIRLFVVSPFVVDGESMHPEAVGQHWGERSRLLSSHHSPGHMAWNIPVDRRQIAKRARSRWDTESDGQPR